MSSSTMPSDIQAFVTGVSTGEMGHRYGATPRHLPQAQAPEAQIEMARRELATVLQYWGYRPELWRIVGFTETPIERPYATESIAHPIVEIVRSRMLVRRQPLGLSERDTLARHALMRHLTERGLPVPTLMPRPDNTTYAIVPVVPLIDAEQAHGIAYVLEDGIYELQTFEPGQRYVTDGPAEDAYLTAAARTLAELHRASAEYAGPIHRLPGERSPLAIARAYLARIAEAGRAGAIPRPIATGLRRLAREGARWVAMAEASLDAHSTLPWLHIHGDYQPHNLAFEAGQVHAIYDFDAMRWDRRVLELAYGLITFAGLRWEADAASPTPPLVARGLDLERARAFLSAYGRVAPPTPGEADLLGDALLLALPVIFANGIAEDLIFADREPHPAHPAGECRPHLEWALTFPAWSEAHRAALSDAWQRGAGR